MEDYIFDHLRNLIKKESGISLGVDKKTLLENRIRKRLRALNLQTAKQYLNVLEVDLDGTELHKLLDVVSTNLTFFYREEAHFHFLAKEMKLWNAEKRAKIRGWCAAASTGEEPYTLAITAAENLNLSNCDFKLLATDICRDVLQHCLKRCYYPDQMKSIPQSQRTKYFSDVQVNGEHMCQVNESLARHILFKRLNLASFPYPISGPFDFIFCRNVMIYFEDDLRSKLINEFYRLLRPGGILVVGHSESLSNIRHTFESVQSAVYRKA
jgi:chemotaxis protein methyltransferase CheR